ncbi:MAG TPA: tripartite tricarboxylate transporter substrate binding protein [Burkholderiales bacterium]|nr:tripartite tricarboxylate transporter substrate binding protein [Burkholderiales bacterium]
MRNTIIAGLIAAAALPAVAAEDASNYPSKPIRLVVPFTPGGSTDILARVIGMKLTEAWGKQVVIDNRPGAGGNIGVDLVAKSPADGYTLVMGHIGTFGVNPTLYPKLPYDPIRDFQPITLVALVPNMLSVNPALPAKSVKELVTLAKAKPGTINFGSGGNGSAAHLAGEYFKLMTKTEITHIPYRGTSPAVTDLIAGQIQMIITGVPPTLNFVKSGKLRALGVATSRRLALLPDLPTIAEAGVPGYEATQWYGVLAPAGTPKPIVTKLNAEMAKAIKGPDVREKLAADAAEPVGNSPEEFGAFIKKEIARWAPVVKASGARPE